MKRLLREPLLHFVLIGAAIFAASMALGGDSGPKDDQIVVSSGKIEHLAALFVRTWQRPPTQNELEGLIADFIKEEAAYREGLTLGLDRDDTIMRRRMRQKLEFVAESLATQVEPTTAELEQFLIDNEERFRIEPQFTIRHVFLDADTRGDTLVADAEDLLVNLNGDPALDWTLLGDRTLLEPAYEALTPRHIANLFGFEFASVVSELEPGAWRGPIASSYGVHLVIIDERVEGRIPSLQEVRDQVQREWSNDRRNEAIDLFYDTLLEQYEVTVQWPDAMAETGQ